MLASKLCTISRRVSRRGVAGVVLITCSSLATENMDRTSETENSITTPKRADVTLAVGANSHRQREQSRGWLFQGRSNPDAKPFPIQNNRNLDSPTNVKN